MYSQIKRQIVAAGLLLTAVLLANPAAAQQPKKSQLVERAQQLRQQAAPTNPKQTILDVNNMTTWLRNDGFFPWEDPFSGVNGTLPKGSGVGAVFTQGIVWGGIVNDGKTPKVRVNGSTYQTGLDPGRVLRDANGNVTGPDNIDPDKYHVWRVHRNWRTMDYTQAAAQFFGKQLGEVTAADRQTVREQYEYDWNNWPAEWGAPYEDVDGDGQYNPEVDIPGYPGADQTLWIVTNDLRSGTSERSYGSPAIGLEYQLTIWGYDFPSSSPLGNIHFARARLIYTGTKSTPADAHIDSMFVTQWVDPDVGNYGDDYAGADTSLSVGYAYNANTQDANYSNYGLAPAAIGWDFLQGPVNTEGDTLGMTSFVYFAAGSDISDPDLSDYSGTLQWYNLMRGMRPRPEYPAGDPFINPLTQEESKFTLVGNPVSGAGWIDGMQLPPGDRRIVLTSGPFSLQRGDTVDVVMGQIGAIGTNNLSSVTVMKYYDQFAQYSYDNNFQLPSPPSVPPVNSAELDKKVVLNWGTDREAVQRIESSVSRGFEFEGYNVYQLPSSNAPLSEGKKVATFDKVNLVSTIFDNVVDDETGFVIEKPVQQSPNEGIQRYVEITRDRLRNRPLANGVKYHFAITAYSYLPEADEDTPFRMLESSPTVVTVTPQPAKPGAEKAPDPLTSVEVSHSGPSTGSVDVTRVDPSQLQSGDYEVTFQYYNPYTEELQQSLAEGDTLREVPDDLFEATEYSQGRRFQTGDPFPVRWALVRNGERISEFFPQIDPNADIPPSSAPVIDGLQVYVPYVKSGEFSVATEGDSWVDGVNWGGALFHGGIDIGANFFGSTLTEDDATSVVLEFQADTSDGWASEGAVYIRDADPSAEGSEYAYAGIGKLPFKAYSVVGGERRQLNVSFVERDPTCSNMRWDLGGATGDASCQELGGREYTFIHGSDYNGGVDYNGTNWAPAADVMWAWWPTLSGDFLANPMTLNILVTKANQPGEDIYSFSVDAPDSGQEDLYEAAVEEINVFPNPYLGYSKLESSRQNKFVTFTHLPEQATIRIFTLNGTMVRRIEHEGSSQFEEWDLTNQDGIPVASGVYIVHVETEYGEKVLKMGLVQEEQILENY